MDNNSSQDALGFVVHPALQPTLSHCCTVPNQATVTSTLGIQQDDEYFYFW